MSTIPVMIKSNQYGMAIRLSPDLPFEELVTAVGEKFRESARFFQNAKMAISFQGRDLTAIEEEQLVAAIVANSRIHVMCIVNDDVQAEEDCRRIVEDAQDKQKFNGEFYRGHINPGESKDFDGTVVILGDVAPGASVTARGNVVILGSCRGSIYAGAGGNRDCIIAALVMKPIQVRIADKVARSAITKRVDTVEYALDPKIVYVKDEHIHVKNLVRSTLDEILGEMGDSIESDKS